MHRLFIALILLSLTYGSYAAEVRDLYQASAPVSSRDEQDRAALTPQLLKQVMLKVVGNQALLESAPLAPVLANADSMLQQYEYQRTNIASADLTRPDELSLILKFAPTAVNLAIRDLDLPVWGKIRPDILVWAAVDNHGEQSLLGLETAPMGVFRPLNEAAGQRGLPVLMPLMDLQDMGAVSFTQVWQGDSAAITAASARYGADIVLLVKVSMQGDEAMIRWQANGKDISDDWQTQGTLNEALAVGVGHLADKLALNYIQVAEQDTVNQRLQLQVSDVMNYGDFTRLMQYLEQLDLVTDIRVNNLSEQQLNLDIAYRGSVELLQRTLAVGSLLIEDSSLSGNDARHYRLTP